MISELEQKYQSKTLETAGISGGSITINAGNDFNNYAANITTTGNADITAGNNVNFSTLELRNRTETSWGHKSKGGSQVVDTTTNVASNINIGGNLNVVTTGLAADAPTDGGSNINIIGSNVSTTGNLNLAAKDEVNITSAQNSSYTYSDFHKNGSTVQKSSKDITQDITNVSSNLSSIGDINISSGKDTNIIASNLSGTNGNILVGKYTDNNPLSATYGQEIINDDAKLTIKSGQDYHYKYHEETKIKTDSTAVAVGAVAAVAVTVATVGTGALLIASAAASGAATGAQGKKGKTTTSETTEVTQKQSNLNFSNDLNIQSASDTTVTASNLTADNATILTGKFRDGGVDTITNTDAKLTLNSAFNTYDNKTTVRKVTPNYVGIAVVAGASAYASQSFMAAINPVTPVGPQVPLMIGSYVIPTSLAITAGAGYTGYSGYSNTDPNSKSFTDPLFNLRSSSSYSSKSSTEIKANMNFNNLITE